MLLVAGLGLQLPTVPPLRNGFRKPDAGEVNLNVPKPELVQGMGAHMAANEEYEKFVEGGMGRVSRWSLRAWGWRWVGLRGAVGGGLGLRRGGQAPVQGREMEGPCDGTGRDMGREEQRVGSERWSGETRSDAATGGNATKGLPPRDRRHPCLSLHLVARPTPRQRLAHQGALVHERRRSAQLGQSHAGGSGPDRFCGCTPTFMCVKTGKVSYIVFVGMRVMCPSVHRAPC